MDLAKKNSAFALHLYCTIAQSSSSHPSNIFFSPFSISALLHLIYFGARTSTLQQLSKALRLDGADMDKISQDYIKLTDEINQFSCSGSDDKISLRTANKLIVEKTLPVHQDYIVRLKKLHTELEQCDFISNAETARLHINQWVENQTDQIIKELIPSGSVDHLTRMILVNAMYFKGQWSTVFNRSYTKPDTFYCLNGSHSVVKMMTQDLKIDSYNDDALDATIIKLPFGSQQDTPTFVMVILLPNGLYGLTSMESMLYSGVADVHLSKCTRQPTELFMPRMQIDQVLPLRRLLQRMGINMMFCCGAAHLSGISDQPQLHVSDAFHKAALTVDETGAVAVAASGAINTVVGGKTRDPNVITIRVDHPFMLLIVDTRTESILFMGRVVDMANLAI